MGGDWHTVALGDICSVVTKGTTPTTVGYAFTEQGINFVKSECITFDGTIDSSKFAFISEGTHEALRRSQLEEGDILFSMAGVFIGKTAVVPKGILPANTNQAVGIIRLDKAKACPRFIDYYLRNPSYNVFLNNLVAQSAQPNLNLTEIKNLPIALPELTEQRAVSAILGSLDDKIALNRRMNETMENIARSMFTAWFVDFEPVRAKIEGRWTLEHLLPGLPQHLLEFFPDELTDGIPKGWHTTTLAAYADLNPENWSKSKAPQQIDYVDLANTKHGRIEGVKHYPWNEAPSRAQRVLRPGDTIIGTVRPGNESYALISATGLTGSTGFAVLRPKTPDNVEVVYLAASASNNIERLAHLADGAAYPAVRPEVVSATQVITPSPTLIQEFSRLVKPILQSIALKHEESSTLAALRDTLLPQLVSGELRVKQAEQLIAGSVP